MATTILLCLALLSIGQAQSDQFAQQWARQGNPVNTREAIECRLKSADIFFLLDSSNSVYIDDWKEELKFVETVTRRLNFGRAVRVGVLTFSTDIRPEISLGAYSSRRSFLRALHRIRKVGRDTYTHKALQYIKSTGFRNARPGIPHIGIVITDGDSTNPRETKRLAREVKEAGIIMFAIGVGPKIKYQELYDMSSSDPQGGSYMFRVSNFASLDSIKDSLATKTCAVVTRPPPTTPVPTILPGCSGTRPLDIVFSIPQQAGVTDTNYYIDFIKKLTRETGISPRQVQVGLAKQIYELRHEIPLKDSQSWNAFRAKLDREKPGGDRIERVLQHIRTSSMGVRQGARRNSIKVAILIEDNKLESTQAVLREAARAKKAGIYIMVIGVGRRQQPRHLRRVASPGAYLQANDAGRLATTNSLRRNVQQKLCPLTRRRT